jgi:hypothetical protein
MLSCATLSTVLALSLHTLFKIQAAHGLSHTQSTWANQPPRWLFKFSHICLPKHIVHCRYCHLFCSLTVCHCLVQPQCSFTHFSFHYTKRNMFHWYHILSVDRHKLPMNLTCLVPFAFNNWMTSTPDHVSSGTAILVVNNDQKCHHLAVSRNTMYVASVMTMFISVDKTPGSK